MKIYFTLEEGGEWYYTNLSRKAINRILDAGIYKSVRGFDFTIKAARIGKSPMIYDFGLLKLKHQPWIRKYEPKGQEAFIRSQL